MTNFESLRCLARTSARASKVAGVFGAAFLLSQATAAGQGTQQQCFTRSVPLQPTNWSTTINLPKFDPALGTLQSIQFTVETEVHGSVGVENTSTSSPSDVDTHFENVIQLKRPDNSILATANPSADFTDTLAVFDNTIDFDGASGETHPNIIAVDTDMTTSPPPASDLPLFTGPLGNPGTIDLPVTAVGSASATGGGNIFVTFTSQAQATVTVCYNYLGNVPPTFSQPQCNSTIPATATVPLSFQVCATDSNPGDTITLAAVTLPAGASTNPPLPQSGPSPVCTTVNWTPASGQVGNHTFTFTATDNHGRSSTCSFTVVVAECHLLIGMGRGTTQVNIWGHLYDTFLNSIRTSFPVTMEDHPPIYLPPNRTIYAQVLMYNPEIFPNNPSQWSRAVKVHRFGDGTLSTVFHGQRNGILLRVVTENINGVEYIRFPFIIE